MCEGRRVTAERDWQTIAAEYISGTDSLRALAGRHAIPCSTLLGRARREGWTARRRAARAEEVRSASGDLEAAPAAVENSAAAEENGESIFRVTDKLVRRAEELLDGGEIGARELGELMRAIKNAKEIKMLRSSLDEREQLARVRALEEKNEPPRRETLRIEFSPEAEEAAR